MSEIKLECPYCKAELVIDKDSERILHSKKYVEPTQSLEDFMKNESSRDQELADKFAEAKKNEDNKLDYINKKFEWAKKNEDKLPDVQRPIDWD